MSVVYICIIRETKAKQSCSGFANTYFHRWSKEISDQRQNACRAWGWLILGRYRRLVGRRSRRQSPSAERGTGHRPLVQHHQSLGKELFAKHLVKITNLGADVYLAEVPAKHLERRAVACLLGDVHPRCSCRWTCCHCPFLLKTMSL